MRSLIIDSLCDNKYNRLNGLEDKYKKLKETNSFYKR